MPVPFLPAGQQISRGLLEGLRVFIPSVAEKVDKGQDLTETDLDDIMLFSPLAIEDVDQELVMFGAAAVGLYLTKTPEGMKLLDVLAKSYFATIADVVSSVSKGASTNVFSSLHSQMITIRLLRRLGLISAVEANVIHKELWWTIQKIFITDVIGDIAVATGTVFSGAGKALLPTK